MSDQPAALARNLRRLRDEAGLSREVLAVRAGVTSSTISRIESDASYEPRMSSVTAIARALGCRMADLFMEPGDPEPGAQEPNGDPKPEARAS